MKVLNVLYVNHLDLTWRRPRYRHAMYNEFVIRPYAELQERMLDRGLQFAREGGVYEIEQTTTLREYIENNPDLSDEISGMIDSGNLRILGGGEAVIDCNLPDGESVIRNQLYSLRYLRETFGITPEFAACPDTFGLSAGLPQLFRQLGFAGLSMYHRVFQCNKSCWRGIDGSVVALDTANSYEGRVLHIGTFKKCPVCPVCGGKGCPACDGLGFVGLRCPADADKLSRICNTIADSGEEKQTLVIMGEESSAADGIIPALRKLAENRGFELNFTGTEELIKKKHRELIDKLINGRISENEIDPRPEGGPVAGGCYTTRIRLKQENRRCENALRCAERLSVMAMPHGTIYPAKALESLWRKLAFFQFHDALPASHSDAAYEELLEISRELRSKAERISLNAARRILGNGSDEKTFAIFNPLEFAIHNVKLTGVGNLPRNCSRALVILPDGRKTPVLSVQRSADACSDETLFTFYGDLPALGYSIFRLSADSETAVAPVAAPEMRALENEFFRVTFSKSGIAEIYDKRSCRVLSGEGSFAPVIEEDCGHPWGRSSIKGYRDRADMPTFNETIIPWRDAPRIELSSENGVQTAVVHVIYSLPERQLASLDWTLTATLADGSDKLEIKIDAAMDAHDLRLTTMLPLAFTPENNMLSYEIPLGSLRRGTVETFDAQLGYSDDYAALRYVSASDGDLSVTLCNSGTPAHRIEGRNIIVSLLRFPTQLCCGFDTDGAMDTSPHTFNFTLSAAARRGAALDSYRRGMVLNTEFPVYKTTLADSESELSHTILNLPNNAMLSALKGAENGDGAICRYIEVEGVDTELDFERGAEEYDILEYGSNGNTQKSFLLKPFEIKTFKIQR